MKTLFLNSFYEAHIIFLEKPDRHLRKGIYYPCISGENTEAQSGDTARPKSQDLEVAEHYQGPHVQPRLLRHAVS